MTDLLNVYKQMLSKLKAERKECLKDYRHLTLAEIIKEAKEQYERQELRSGPFESETFEKYLEWKLKESANMLIQLENKTDIYTQQIKELEAIIKRIKKEYY